MKRRFRHDQGGFTLIELLMAIAIGSIVIGAVASSLVVGLRTTDVTAERLTESIDTQLVSTYLVPDVQSAGPGAGGMQTASSVGSGCSGSAPGSNVLALRWSEAIDTTTQYAASYRLVTAGTETQLVRYHCENGAAPAARVLARALSPADGARAVIASTGERVTLTIKLSSNAYQASVTALRRSSLPAAVPPALSAQPACGTDNAFTSADPAYRSSLGVLLTPVTVTVETTGTSCNNLRAVYRPGGAGQPAVETSLTQGPANSWSAELQSTGWAETPEARVDLFWSDTPTSVRNFLVKVEFEVRTAEACALAQLVVSPSGGERRQNPTPNVLSSPGNVVVEVTSSATCSALTLLYNPTGPGDPGTSDKAVSLTKVTDTTWRGEIPSSERWTDGEHPLVLREGVPASLSPLELGRHVFEVAPRPCSVVSFVANPNPVARSGSPNNATGTLQSSVTLTATMDGVCASLQARFQPNPTSPAVVLDLAQSTEGSDWSATISKTTYQWSLGDKTVELLRDGSVMGSTILRINS